MLALNNFRSRAKLGSSFLPFAWGVAKPLAHAPAESLALLGRHVLRVAAAAGAESTEQNAAQHQEAQGLPARDLRPAEEWRQQHIPEPHHDLAHEGKEERERDEHDRRDVVPLQKPFDLHVRVLMVSS